MKPSMRLQDTHCDSFIPSLSLSLSLSAPPSPCRRHRSGELAIDAETRKRKAVAAEEEDALAPLSAEVSRMEEGSNSNPNPNPNPDPDPDMSSVLIPEEWSCYRDDEVMQQHNAIMADEAVKVPFVGDKEPISSLAAEFESGSSILQEKIKLLGEQYVALRRTRGDGNCFFRSFMFSYLEHILETQDKTEVDRISAKIEQCKNILQSLGHADFTFEDFFTEFSDLLGSVLHVKDTSVSLEELVQKSRESSTSNYVVMFFRFVTSGEIRRRADFYEPFIAGLTNTTVDQFCRASVEPMGEESDHVHITSLSDALGVAIRVVYLDRSSCDAGSPTVNHHDFIPSQSSASDSSSSAASDAPQPFVMLLYRPGHYDILYSK